VVDAAAAKLAPEVLNVAPEQLPRHFSRTIEQHGPALQITLTIDANGARPAAREFIDLLTREVLNYLESTRGRAIERRMTGARESVSEAEQRLQTRTQELRTLEKSLRDASGRVDVSPQNLMDAVRQLDETHMQLEIEQAAKHARREALTKALAESKNQIEQRMKEDPVVAEMEKILQIRTEAMQRKRQLHEQGLLSNEELADAEAQLAEVRAQLLERRQEAAERAGADIMHSWNRELLALSVDENEMLARLEQVKRRLDKLRSMVDAVNQLEDLQRRIEHAQDRLRDAQARMENLADHLREIAERPDTSVMRSQGRAPAPATTQRN
jgi:chromosome segregation ATPase